MEKAQAAAKEKAKDQQKDVGTVEAHAMPHKALSLHHINSAERSDSAAVLVKERWARIFPMYF